MRSFLFFLSDWRSVVVVRWIISVCSLSSWRWRAQRCFVEEPRAWKGPLLPGKSTKTFIWTSGEIWASRLYLPENKSALFYTGARKTRYAGRRQLSRLRVAARSVMVVPTNFVPALFSFPPSPAGLVGYLFGVLLRLLTSLRGWAWRFAWCCSSHTFFVLPFEIFSRSVISSAHFFLLIFYLLFLFFPLPFSSSSSNPAQSAVAVRRP